MPKSTYYQNNFNFGELSPRALARFDPDKPIWKNGCELMENFICNQLGGAIYRPGTYYAGTAKYSDRETRLIKFQYSTTQTYHIEVGDEYFRFFSNKAKVIKALTDVSAWVLSHSYVVGDYVSYSSQVYYCIVDHLSAAFTADLIAGYWVLQNTYELPTPYGESDIKNIKYTQSFDTMWLCHGSYFPQKLQRTASNSFTISDVPFIRGPFRDTNPDSTSTITPSSATGATVLTSTDNIFHSTHVGSLWRIKDGVVLITAYTSPTQVSGIVQDEPDGVTGDLGTTSATYDWAEGAFSDYRGYPVDATFFEGRLYYAKDETIYGSVVGAYDNFASGTDSSDAVTFSVATRESMPILWMLAGGRNSGILCGTESGVITGKSGAAVSISASNPPIFSFDVDYGVSSISPISISSNYYCVQKSKYQIRELTYNFTTDSIDGIDMNKLSDHILRDGSGAVDMARQQSPNDRVWVVRDDGTIAVLTRNKEENVMGWCRVVLGQSSGFDGKAKSVSITPTSGGDDEIWIVAERIINGSVKQFIEYFSLEFTADNDGDNLRLDCALSLNNPIAMSGATAANPVVITTTLAHGLSNGDQIKIDGVEGMTELNRTIFLVNNATTYTFSLKTPAGSAVDGSDYTEYLSGGEVRKMVTAISGLSHLEGETVYVVVDGGLPAGDQEFTVSGGAITLAHKAAVVHVGLKYTGMIELLSLSDGLGPTKPRRVYLTTLRLLKSLGGSVGQSLGNMQPFYYNRPDDVRGLPPPLVTADLENVFDSGWSKKYNVYIVQDKPLPFNILSIIMRNETEEKN